MLSTTSTNIDCTDVATGLSFDALVAVFERELEHWDAEKAKAFVRQKAPWREVEAEAARVGGSSGLMIIGAINQGAVTSLSGTVKNCMLYLVGNPVIANQVLDIDPRAALYVPFRVCLYSDGGPGGARVRYDRPSSFLAVLGHPELGKYGELLDDKIDGVVRAVGEAQLT